MNSKFRKLLNDLDMILFNYYGLEPVSIVKMDEIEDIMKRLRDMIESAVHDDNPFAFKSKEEKDKFIYAASCTLNEIKELLRCDEEFGSSWEVVK